MYLLPPAPAGLDLAETQVPRILGVNITLWALSVLAVLLRFAARRFKKTGFWWDDYIIVPALILGGINCLASTAWMLPDGYGRHIWAAPPNATETWAKALFTTEICYTVAVTCVKFSLLLFYWRIFQYSRIRVPIYVLSALVAAWGIAVTFGVIFQCWPVEGAWTRFSPEDRFTGNCTLSIFIYFKYSTIPNIITSAALIILPVPFIWRLQLRLSHRIGMSSIFAIGIFVDCVAVLRLVCLIRIYPSSPDVTWNFTDLQLWTCVEINVGIICACLPSLGPFLTTIFRWVSQPHSRLPEDGPSIRSEAHLPRRQQSDDRTLNLLINKTHHSSRIYPVQSLSDLELNEISADEYDCDQRDRQQDEDQQQRSLQQIVPTPLSSGAHRFSSSLSSHGLNKDAG